MQRPFEILNSHSMSSNHWYHYLVGKPISNGHQFFFGARKIHLIGGNHPGPLTESWIVKVKFAPQGSKVLDRIASFASGCVENEKQQFTAHDMAQKIMTKSHVLMSTGEQARMSASVARLYPSNSKTPMTGFSVVNGYGATLGCAAETLPSKVDFPAFGYPRIGRRQSYEVPKEKNPLLLVHPQ